MGDSPGICFPLTACLFTLQDVEAKGEGGREERKVNDTERDRENLCVCVC